MKLKTDNFRNACTIIKNAIDTKGVTLYTETLELKATGNVLNMNVTNREYYVTVKFNAAINAQTFLSLISKITTEYITLKIADQVLHVYGNGEYKLPLLYSDNKIMELPKININNVTNEFAIESDVLQSIAKFNSKELLRAIPVNPVQKYYYVDEHGAITFTSGACINNFELEKPIKMLLSDKVVKLFKLFKQNKKVDFVMGQDALTEDIIQTKVRFSTNNIVITAILSESSLITSVPVTAIRDKAMKDFKYSIVISRDEFSSALDRLMLFGDDVKKYGKFNFGSTGITITDITYENTESVQIKDECKALETEPYTAILNIPSLKLVIDDAEDDYVTVCFGDHTAIIVKKTNIINLIAEAH